MISVHSTAPHPSAPGRTAPEAHAPVYDGLHPRIYAIIIALAVWLLMSAWLFFGGLGYDDMLLTVVTGLFVVSIGIPVLLWLTWRRNADHGDDGPAPSFRDWRSGEFATWTGRHVASGAAIETLLPIAAVAFGMTAIGLVFVFTAT